MTILERTASQPELAEAIHVMEFSINNRIACAECSCGNWMVKTAIGKADPLGVRVSLERMHRAHEET